MVKKIEKKAIEDPELDAIEEEIEEGNKDLPASYGSPEEQPTENEQRISFENLRHVHIMEEIEGLRKSKIHVFNRK